MDGVALAAVSAAWLGFLTSISPCPLATNIAAMSFIGRSLNSPRRVVLTGALYTLGRTVAYTALAALLIASVFALPDVSFFLEMYMNKVLGPVLLIVGILLLDLVPIRYSGSCVTEKFQDRFSKSGLVGAGVLGMVFALSFCPVSAALFFGSLIPLAIQYGSIVGLPSIYGISTGLPVFVFAVLIAIGARWVSRAFNRVVQFEKWARRITGIIFILVGIRYCLNYIFEVQI